MARWYTRSQQRKYREERQRKAQLVADRLLGKKKIVLPANHDDFMDAMTYKWASNLWVASPRHGCIITGIEGV